MIHISFYITRYHSYNFLELHLTSLEKKVITDFPLLPDQLNPQLSQWSKSAKCDKSVLLIFP